MQQTPQKQLPPLGRMMVFVDGENLVYRYQNMLKNSCIPDDRVVHESDTFVWQPRSVRCRENIVARASYYTYCTGEKERVSEITAKIKKLEFRQYDVPGLNLGQLMKNLTPVVFWKSRQRARAKGVDIQLTVDVLNHVYRDHLDVVYLISGDGGYKPVIKEAMRQGKHVYVAALSDGLDSELPLIADDFLDLDHVYFKEVKPI